MPPAADEPVPAIDAEGLLSGQRAVADADELRPAADLLAALRVPAHPHELAGQPHALDAFCSQTVARPPKETAVPEPGSPWRRIVHPRFAAKAAAAAVIGSVALGGVAAAATTGSLPGPLQAVAHVLGAPAGGDSTDGTLVDGTISGTPTGTDAGTPAAPSTAASADPSASRTSSGPTRGPDALGPAAWGLCHGFENKIWGNGAGSTASPNPAGRKPNNPSVAYANLVAAATSKGLTVDGFCTVVLANHGVPSTWPTTAPSTASSTSTSSAPAARPTHGHGHGHGQGHPRGGGNGHPQG